MAGLMVLVSSDDGVLQLKMSNIYLLLVVVRVEIVIVVVRVVIE